MRGLPLVFPSFAGGVVMGFAALVVFADRDVLLRWGAFAWPKLSALLREENKRK